MFLVQIFDNGNICINFICRILVKGPTRGSDCKQMLDGKTVAITGKK